MKGKFGRQPSSLKALSLSVNFNDIFLPAGSRLQLFNNRRTDIASTYTIAQNRDERELRTWLIGGGVYGFGNG